MTAVRGILYPMPIIPTQEQDTVTGRGPPADVVSTSATFPDPTDKHVGNRVRMRRMMLGMSQTKLGDALGLTFQQVQKYERGTNRIGAGRLQQLAYILQVPVPFFFEGLPLPSETSSEEDAYVADFLATCDGLSLAKYFMRIKNSKLRRCIVELAEHVAARYN